MTEAMGDIERRLVGRRNIDRRGNRIKGTAFVGFFEWKCRVAADTTNILRSCLSQTSTVSRRRVNGSMRTGPEANHLDPLGPWFDLNRVVVVSERAGILDDAN